VPACSASAVGAAPTSAWPPSAPPPAAAGRSAVWPPHPHSPITTIAATASLRMPGSIGGDCQRPDGDRLFSVVPAATAHGSAGAVASCCATWGRTGHGQQRLICRVFWHQFAPSRGVRLLRVCPPGLGRRPRPAVIGWRPEELRMPRRAPGSGCTSRCRLVVAERAAVAAGGGVPAAFAAVARRGGRRGGRGRGRGRRGAAVVHHPRSAPSGSPRSPLRPRAPGEHIRSTPAPPSSCPDHRQPGRSARWSASVRRSVCPLRTGPANGEARQC
jgi:hypothetical protein